MIVEVTQEDIDAGKVDDGYACPLALAFQRKLDAVDINVGCWSVFVGNEERYRTRQPARDFIQRFDDHEPVKPGTFIFDEDGRCE